MENEQLSFLPQVAPAKYAGPTETARVRKAGTRELMQVYAELGEQREYRVSLADPEQVREAVRDYLRFCAEREIFPSIEGFCTMCHCSRTWFYDYLTANPQSKSGQILEDFRNTSIAVKIAGNERGLVSDASMIFQLKNVGAGFADKVEVIPAPPASPLDNLDATEARKRLTEAIPDDD